MCTMIILRRPGHDWPLLVAANRDEMADRPWEPPARHWSDRDHVIAGRDVLAGGSWLGVNDYGLVAGVLNRMNTLGPAPGLRSRGELPLEALDHAEATIAADALAHLDPAAYRPFNMIVGDATSAFWLANRGERIDMAEIPEGVSMITAYDLNDPESPRTRRYLPQFKDAPTPDPATGDWSSWQHLMGNPEHDAEAGPGGAMRVETATGFGTVSSSLIALPRPKEVLEAAPQRPVWLFAAGRPGDVSFEPVEI